MTKELALSILIKLIFNVQYLRHLCVLFIIASNRLYTADLFTVGTGPYCTRANTVNQYINDNNNDNNNNNNNNNDNNKKKKNC